MSDQAFAAGTLGLVSSQLTQLHGDLVRGVAELRASLDQKADKGDIAEMRGELRSQHERIAKLEESDRVGRTRDDLQAEQTTRVFTVRQRHWAIVGGMATVLASWGTLIVAIVRH